MHSIGLVPDKRDQKKERLRIACAHRCRCPKPHLYDAVPEEVPEGNTLRIISPARLNRQVLARVRGGEKGRSRRPAQPMHCTRTSQLAQSLDEKVCLHNSSTRQYVHLPPTRPVTPRPVLVAIDRPDDTLNQSHRLHARNGHLVLARV